MIKIPYKLIISTNSDYCNKPVVLRSTSGSLQYFFGAKSATYESAIIMTIQCDDSRAAVSYTPIRLYNTQTKRYLSHANLRNNYISKAINWKENDFDNSTKWMVDIIPHKILTLTFKIPNTNYYLKTDGSNLNVGYSNTGNYRWFILPKVIYLFDRIINFLNKLKKLICYKTISAGLIQPTKIV